MAIGTNDVIVKTGTQKTLEANGASCANNAIVTADDATYSIAADGSNAPDAEFALAVTFATAPTENATIDLYAQELNFDGTNDEQAIETTYKPKYIASFVVNNVTTIQYLNRRASRLPRDATYVLHNNGTGQTFSAGWTLKVLPVTVGPSA
ncbi:MAG: hypothetical protein A2Y38_19100 [Spirochaetes bacterium GWB1_59_5]|nr:MAG: hypothetical protein A2Y38_19100 [Spirochaetes bacterium GWB1_59_5]